VRSNANCRVNALRTANVRIAGTSVNDDDTDDDDAVSLLPELLSVLGSSTALEDGVEDAVYMP